MVLVETNSPVHCRRPTEFDAYLPGKGLKNLDHKAKGLFFRVTVAKNAKRLTCERRYKDFEYLRVALARAFSHAINAGRLAYRGGAMVERDSAAASTPVVGTPFWHHTD